MIRPIFFLHRRYHTPLQAVLTVSLLNISDCHTMQLKCNFRF